MNGSPFSENLFGSREQRTRTLSAFVDQEWVVVFRAQDPNPEDEVSIMLLQDPGLPQGAVLGDNKCEPESIRYPDGVDRPSACSIASRNVSWTPEHTSHGQTHVMCVVARDDKDYCSGVGTAGSLAERVTPAGWYGEEH